MRSTAADSSKETKAWELAIVPVDIGKTVSNAVRSPVRLSTEVKDLEVHKTEA